MNNYQSFYVDLMFKDGYKSKNKSAMGEMYRFLKSHFVPDHEPCEKIALDNIYNVYKGWCKTQGIQPIHFHGFSKLTRIIMGARHLHFQGKSCKGGARRWLSGFQFRKPIEK